MKKHDRIFIGAVALVCLAVLCISSTGCEPLRKKFTRKKKEDERQMVDPVLEPIDYPPLRESPEKRYQYHYSMWRVWQKDLLLSLNDGKNDKRSKYLLGQTSVELEEMDKWIVGDKKDGLNEVIAQYHKLGEEVQKPLGIRDTFAVIRTLESQDKNIRHNFSPDKVKEFYTPIP